MVMLLIKLIQDKRRVYVKGQPIVRVREYKYLDTTINEDNDSSKSVRIRID